MPSLSTSAIAVGAARDPTNEEMQRARALAADGSVTEALALARQMASRFPQSVQTCCCLGELLLAAGQSELALQMYSKAVDLQHDHVPALIGQARVSRQLGLNEDAVDSLEIAIAHDPRALEALLELANLYEEAEVWSEVSSLLGRALAIDPGQVDLWLRLATAYDRCERFDDAISAGERALAIDPKCVAAWVNLGMVHLQRCGDPSRAEGHFRQALAVDPACDVARADLGLALHEQGRFEEALALYADAIERAPDFVEFRWNRGLAHLANGNFAAGWIDYETRFERDGGRARRDFPYLPWGGELQFEGALLIYAEQGLGDEIMFASCLPDLVDRGAAVVLECNPRLESLFSRSFPGIEVRGQPRGRDRSWLGDYPTLARQTPIGSLPRWLRAGANQFPRHRGYLHAEPRRIEKWRERLAGSSSGLKVGLTWRGGTLNTRRSQKSIPLDALLPLLSVPRVQYVCLQHDVRENEREWLIERKSKIVLWPEACADLEETAALITVLDLTVSVSATNAHLAGALGRPLWLLLNASPEWRWSWAGDSTPWYPSARLWRQRRSGDWAGVVAALCAHIGEMANRQIESSG